MNKEESANILSFMSPRAGVLVLGSDNISRIVKMQYFFFFFLLWAWIRQIIFTQKYIHVEMMTKDVYTKIVNLITPN